MRPFLEMVPYIALIPIPVRGDLYTLRWCVEAEAEVGLRQSFGAHIIVHEDFCVLPWLFVSMCRFLLQSIRSFALKMGWVQDRARL